MTDEKTTAADGQPDPGTPTPDRHPLILRLIEQDAFTAEECRGIAEEARSEAEDATADEDLALALAALAGGACEAADAAARAVRRAAGLITPSTSGLVPTGARMAVHAMEDATEAVCILHEAFTDGAPGGEDVGGDDEEEGDDDIVPIDEIPLANVKPEKMN